MIDSCDCNLSTSIYWLGCVCVSETADVVCPLFLYSLYLLMKLLLLKTLILAIQASVTPY